MSRLLLVVLALCGLGCAGDDAPATEGGGSGGVGYGETVSQGCIELWKCDSYPDKPACSEEHAPESWELAEDAIDMCGPTPDLLDVGAVAARNECGARVCGCGGYVPGSGELICP